MVDHSRRCEKRPNDMRVRDPRLQPPGQLRGRARSAQSRRWEASVTIASQLESGSRSAKRRQVIRSGRSHAPAIARRPATRSVTRAVACAGSQGLPTARCPSREHLPEHRPAVPHAQLRRREQRLHHGFYREPIKGVSDLDVAYWCYETKQKVLFLWFQVLENQNLPKTSSRPPSSPTIWPP
jgi:hypothetical protein